MAQDCRRATGEQNMRAHLIAATVLSTALTITSACAPVLISGDNGDLMEDYTARFQQVRQSGEPVVIDGACYSACTMLLGLLPRDQVCATPNAVLGFHAAWQFDKSGGRVASASGNAGLDENLFGFGPRVDRPPWRIDPQHEVRARPRSRRHRRALRQSLTRGLLATCAARERRSPGAPSGSASRQR